MSSDNALIQEEDNDYVLRAGETSCWITVDNISIHVIRQEYSQCVSIKLYPLGHEGLDCLPLDTAKASFEEAEDIIMDKKITYDLVHHEINHIIARQDLHDTINIPGVKDLIWKHLKDQAIENIRKNLKKREE